VIGGALGDEPAPAKAVLRLPRADGDQDRRHAYFAELLRLAVRATAEAGPLELQQAEVPASAPARALRELQQGDSLDVMWMMTTVERERDLLPVRVPLLKGFSGCRVLLIRQADRARFAKVHTLADLQAFVAGQGTGWPDVAVLRANGLRVEEGRNADNLCDMLVRQRFDFYPRSVCEAWGDVPEHTAQGLMVEPRLVLYYPIAIYFFLPRRQAELAARLERGLRLAQADGSFDRLFDEHHGAYLQHLRQSDLVILPLHNPNLPPGTPPVAPEIWQRVFGQPPPPVATQP
jgi:hypothetical protein